MPEQIAIQGYEGSFHHSAAEQYFGKAIAIAPCASFRELVQLVEDKKVDAGLMAIENSIAGSILPNYRLLQAGKLHICGEVYLPIKQHLLVNAGVGLADVREVHSHPMAIQQCIDYLVQHPWKLVETEDTALSAKAVQQKRLRHTAAIAGKRAAELFNLEILAENIHTEKKNFTRFLVLSKKELQTADANKATIAFETEHKRGSLAAVLQLIADNNINLSKLQSMPVPGSNFLYRFYADLEFDEQTQFKAVLQELKTKTGHLKIFGIYKNGK